MALNDPRLTIAAIRFLNPAPLMWDFEHLPLAPELSTRYRIDWMLPSACADHLADGSADIGLVPIAALPVTPGLRIIPGCTIASKGAVRSLLLVRRAQQELSAIRTVAADTASRTTIAHARILFRRWDNPAAQFIPMSADLDKMLADADAAIVIGDPALFALEDRTTRQARTGEELVYHDLAQEWRTSTGMPFVSAVWAVRESVPITDRLIDDFVGSRDHGLAHVDDLAQEWSAKMALPQNTIRAYLTKNIHYVLDEECIEGMRMFYRLAADAGILPAFTLALP